MPSFSDILTTVQNGVVAMNALSTQLQKSFTDIKNNFTTINNTILNDFPVNFISGLTLSTAGSSATFSVATGAATDTTNVDFIKLASAFSKTTSAWAVGSGSGSLDTGAIAANTWYHAFLIKRPDTGGVDVLTSLSATAPTMPANYTLFRRIGSMRTGGSSNWTLFHQNGIEFLWDVPTADATAVAFSASPVSRTLTVPTGIQVNAFGQVRADFATNAAAWTMSSLDITAPTVGTTTTTLVVSATSTSSADYFNMRTSTAAQVRVQANNTGPTYNIGTFGWIDPRGVYG